jgi:hypothetical protein
MAFEDKWFDAAAALVSHAASDPKPLAELLRTHSEIPAATIQLLATLLDPPPDDPLGMQFRIVEVSSHNAEININSETEQSGAKTTANAGNEPWQGEALKRAIILYATAIRAATRYSQIFMKWINHDL